MTTILLVDDDADFRTVLDQELTDQGYQVIGAPNGVWGFQTVLDMDVDVVLLDWNMPHRSGLETLRLIRTVKPDAKVIVVTALMDDASRNAARQLGVSEIIFKPISIKGLLAAIQRALGGGSA